MSSLILNEVFGIVDRTYLELGVGDAVNFGRINCISKMSVDINGRGLYHGTTDAFFAALPVGEKWDFIFIDANHDYEFVLNDFNHAVLHCNHWILIHDMIPPSKRFTAQRFCSDSYRLLYFLLTQTAFDVYCLNEDMGLTFIRMPVEPVHPAPRFERLGFESFQKHMQNVRLYSPAEIVAVLEASLPPCAH